MGDFKNMGDPRQEIEDNTAETAERVFQPSSKSYDFDDSHAPLALLGRNSLLYYSFHLW